MDDTDPTATACDPIMKRVRERARELDEEEENEERRQRRREERQHPQLTVRSCGHRSTPAWLIVAATSSQAEFLGLQIVSPALIPDLTVFNEKQQREMAKIAKLVLAAQQNIVIPELPQQLAEVERRCMDYAEKAAVEEANKAKDEVLPCLPGPRYV